MMYPLTSRMPQEMLLHALQSAPRSSPTTTTLSLEMPQQLFRPLQQPQTLFRFSEHLSQTTLQLLICQTGQALQERIFQVLQTSLHSMSRLNASRSSSRMQRTLVSSTAHLSQTVSTSQQLLPNTLRTRDTL